MDKHIRYALSTLLAAASLGMVGTAHAYVTITGDVSPGSPSDPWDLGSSSLRVGGASNPWEPTFNSGEVSVASGGQLFSAGAFVGNDRSGTVQVIGYGSTWTNSGSIQLCVRGSNCQGLLVVRNGAEVLTDDLVVGNRSAESYGGNVLVEGYDATLTSQVNTYVGLGARGRVDIKQGGSFFSNNVYIGGGSGASGCSSCNGHVTVTGSATRWVSTGEFILGVNSQGTLDIDRAEVFTNNARIGRAETLSRSKASVHGWGGTWTNQGLFRVGTVEGSGELTIGAYGTLVTEDTEIHSELGHAFIKVNDVYASWLNTGDVTVFASGNASPSIVVGKHAFVSIDGLLRTAPKAVGLYPYLGPSVRIEDGDLIAGAMEVEAGDLDFAGGRLETGSFVGDLANMQSGELSVGEAHPATDIVGGYSQGPGATLRIVVGGSSPSPLLEVDGDLLVDGALEVVPADGSVSFQVGDTVALLGWGGDLEGTFAAVNIALPLGPGLAWDTSALYTTGEITVVPAT
jgi:T5SS/PEP-CTERM-associated repeat protein